MSTLQERMEQRLRERWEVRKLNNIFGPKPGSIWLAQPDFSKAPHHRPVVLIRTRSERPEVTVLSVAEVSRDIPHALDDDIILESELTGFSYRCMVRTSNLFPTSPDQLDCCLGELDDPLMAIINRVAGHCITKMTVEEAIGLGAGMFSLEPVAFTPLINYGNFVRTGFPCTSESDPRLARLRLAHHNRRYLSQEVKRYW